MRNLQGSAASSSCSFHVHGLCVLELLLIVNDEQVDTNIYLRPYRVIIYHYESFQY